MDDNKHEREETEENSEQSPNKKSKTEQEQEPEYIEIKKHGSFSKDEKENIHNMAKKVGWIIPKQLDDIIKIAQICKGIFKKTHVFLTFLSNEHSENNWKHTPVIKLTITFKEARSRALYQFDKFWIDFLMCGLTETEKKFNIEFNEAMENVSGTPSDLRKNAIERLLEMCIDDHPYEETNLLNFEERLFAFRIHMSLSGFGNDIDFSIPRDELVKYRQVIRTKHKIDYWIEKSFPAYFNRLKSSWYVSYSDDEDLNYESGKEFEKDIDKNVNKTNDSLPTEDLESINNNYVYSRIMYCRFSANITSGSENEYGETLNPDLPNRRFFTKSSLKKTLRDFADLYYNDERESLIVLSLLVQNMPSNITEMLNGHI